MSWPLQLGVEVRDGGGDASSGASHSYVSSGNQTR
jgi:hypothetical protein